MLRPTVVPTDVEQPTYESIPTAENGQPPRGMKFLRYTLIVAVVAALSVFAVDKGLEHAITGSDAEGQPTHLGGIVGLMAVQDDAGCPNDGSICICTHDYAVSPGIQGQLGNRNVLTKSPGRIGCQPFKFKVGDLLFVEMPSGNDPKYKKARMVASFTGSKIVHNAVVMEVPPGAQTADTVFVEEALKGVWRKVLRNSLTTLVTRYPFGGISVRRVDAAKYPSFFTPETTARIVQWGQKILGEPFDTTMVNPAKKWWSKWYVSPNPGCAQRKAANALYARGGPQKWICSQLIAWTVAFAGGLNLGVDGDGIRDGDWGCKVDQYVVQDLQPYPGTMLNAAWTDPNIQFRAPCAPTGCFIGVSSAASTGKVDGKACPAAFPHASPTHPALCYKTADQANALAGAPCPTWCTRDVNVGSGCGDNTQKLCQAATEAPTETPTDASTDAPKDATTDKATTDAPTEATTEATNEATTVAPTKATSEATSEATTEAPTKATSEATTEAATQAPTHAPTDATTDAPPDKAAE